MAGRTKHFIKRIIMFTLINRNTYRCQSLKAWLHSLPKKMSLAAVCSLPEEECAPLYSVYIYGKNLQALP